MALPELDRGTPKVAPSVKAYPVAEIFGPVIQGEGELIGIPTLFVRFGGCDYRCSWCDSLHAVLPQYKSSWERLSADEIVMRLGKLVEPPYFVTLSGGNPALHDLSGLLDLMTAAGYLSVIETQGTRFPAWLTKCHSVVLSPKPPSSGETPDLDEFFKGLFMLDAMGHKWYSVKVVVMDERDLDFADDVRQRLFRLTGKPLILQVGNEHPPHDDDTASRDALALFLLARWRWLTGEVLRRGWMNVRVLPQLHVLAHGNERGR